MERLHTLMRVNDTTAALLEEKKNGTCHDFDD
jgi:hypothetical protein